MVAPNLITELRERLLIGEGGGIVGVTVGDDGRRVGSSDGAIGLVDEGCCHVSMADRSERAAWRGRRAPHGIGGCSPRAR